MKPIAHEPGTIEAFAVVCAHLADPFADRPALLRAAGLDEARFREREEHWLPRLGRDDPNGRDLVERFSQAYAGGRAPSAEAAAPAPSLEDLTRAPPSPPEAPASPLKVPERPAVHEPRPLAIPSFLKERPAVSPAPVSAAPAPAPPAPQPTMSNETAEVNVAQLLAGLSAKLPFDPTRPSAAAVPSAAPRAREGLSGETTDIDVAALARKALATGPAAKAPAAPMPATVELSAVDAAPAPAGKRLVRFDPQTGKPLAEPRWEDLPATPGRKDR